MLLAETRENDSNHLASSMDKSLMYALQDIFLLPGGMRLRARISHGQMEIEFPSQAALGGSPRLFVQFLLVLTIALCEAYTALYAEEEKRDQPCLKFFKTEYSTSCVRKSHVVPHRLGKITQTLIEARKSLESYKHGMDIRLLDDAILIIFEGREVDCCKVDAVTKALHVRNFIMEIISDVDDNKMSACWRLEGDCDSSAAYESIDVNELLHVESYAEKITVRYEDARSRILGHKASTRERRKLIIFIILSLACVGISDLFVRLLRSLPWIGDKNKRMRRKLEHAINSYFSFIHRFDTNSSATISFKGNISHSLENTAVAMKRAFDKMMGCPKDSTAAAASFSC